MPSLPAVPAAHDERQAPIAETPANHPGQVENAPAVAAQAVGVKLVLVFMEAGDAAKVDHGARVAPIEAQATRPQSGTRSYQCGLWGGERREQAEALLAF